MKALTWRSVSGGIAGLVAIVLIVLFVLTFARTGRLRGEKFRMFVAVPDASNVLEGTEVWVDGQRVGTVRKIAFAPAAAPADERVVITAEVLDRFRDRIRLDSRANLQSGGTIIGAPVVYLTSGTPRARIVGPGDTIRGAGKSDLEIAASRATEAIDAIPGIVADMRVIMSNAEAAGSRMNAIVRDGAPGAFAARSERLLQRLSSASGSAGRLMHDLEMRSQLSHVVAEGDSLRRLLGTRRNEVGRFRRDNSLGPAVRTLREDVAALRVLASSPDGTVGRLATDSALVRGLDSLFIELGALMADIRKNPLRYARVF